MSAREPMTHFGTHNVVNQPCPLENYNVYSQNQALVEGPHREGAARFDQSAQTLGESAGSEDVIRLGFLANNYPPELKTYDRYGQRIDEIEFHPAYHELMRLGFGTGIHSIAWNNHAPGGHVAHTALIYLMTQVDGGVCCPIAMSYATVPALKRQPDIASQWLPKILSQHYDPRCIPASEKTGCTIGMAMTEKQGGSDVRSNTTRATPVVAGGPGEAYHLTGHKWFYSTPMSDVFLTLAKTNAGLSCFLVPRWLPDGRRNRFYIQRVKHKLGNRSNASAEMEYHNTWAQLIGKESEGVKTIIDMVHHTRLDASASGAGLMRAALVQATHHAVHRSAFGKRLIKQPGMQNVLADLALESEAATILFLRVARTFDDSGVNESERLLCRLCTALAKYWINKRAPAFVTEALECHGRAGYIEESIMPRLYREAPLNGI
jgi:putative acyl-CoA dehydrogenase